MLEIVSDSLADTFVSRMMQEWLWTIPAVQTIHILALSLALTAGLLLELGILRANMSREGTSALMQRFDGWITYPLLVAGISGLLLVAGEPGRALMNAAFWTKMLMFAVLLMVFVTRRRWLLRADRVVAPGQLHGLLPASAVLSIGLWLAIPSLGRWIAYVDSF